jgi:hypothetical protein
LGKIKNSGNRMAKENKTRDDINSNDTLNSDNQTGATTGHENTGKNKKL